MFWVVYSIEVMYGCAQLCLSLNSSDELSNETSTKARYGIAAAAAPSPPQQSFELKYVWCVRPNGISAQYEMR